MAYGPHPGPVAPGSGFLTEPWPSDCYQKSRGMSWDGLRFILAKLRRTVCHQCPAPSPGTPASHPAEGLVKTGIISEPRRVSDFSGTQSVTSKKFLCFLHSVSGQVVAVPDPDCDLKHATKMTWAECGFLRGVHHGDWFSVVSMNPREGALYSRMSRRNFFSSRGRGERGEHVASGTGLGKCQQLLDRSDQRLEIVRLGKILARSEPEELGAYAFRPVAGDNHNRDRRAGIFDRLNRLSSCAVRQAMVEDHQMNGVLLKEGEALRCRGGGEYPAKSAERKAQAVADSGLVINNEYAPFHGIPPTQPPPSGQPDPRKAPPVIQAPADQRGVRVWET